MLKAIITDIEGTTSSIDFVHQTLFPYAKKHLRAFLTANGHLPEVQVQLQAVAADYGSTLNLEQAIATLEQWMQEDRKATPLKALQGMIWAQGYANGELTGHVYADTPEYLRKWHAQGLQLYVYSSGSTAAQKLIFGHTAYGDLTPLFSGYFDTRVGGKRDSQSYANILANIKIDAAHVLFLSDIVEELDAAKAVGITSVQLIRDETAVISNRHPLARDFSEISI